MSSPEEVIRFLQKKGCKVYEAPTLSLLKTRHFIFERRGGEEERANCLFYQDLDGKGKHRVYLEVWYGEEEENPYQTPYIQTSQDLERAFVMIEDYWFKHQGEESQMGRPPEFKLLN